MAHTPYFHRNTLSLGDEDGHRTYRVHSSLKPGILSYFTSSFNYFIFAVGNCYVAQAGLESTSSYLSLLNCCDYRCGPGSRNVLTLCRCFEEQSMIWKVWNLGFLLYSVMDDPFCLCVHSSQRVSYLFVYLTSCCFSLPILSNLPVFPHPLTPGLEYRNIFK